MYSQRDEEKTILKYAPSEGTYLDIGAFDEKLLSNTRALYERGWAGILVEPSPECFIRLIESYRNDPRIVLVNALLTAKSDALVKFYSSPDAVGTSCEENYKTWKGHASFAEIYVPALPIQKLIDGLSITHLDFINIDSEGTSFELLKALDLVKLKCSMVCVEYDRHEIPIRSHLNGVGFGITLQTDENLVATRGL